MQQEGKFEWERGDNFWKREKEGKMRVLAEKRSLP
jgi:hypothetical protein